MTHKDTLEQKTEEDKENEDRNRGAIKGGGLSTREAEKLVWQRITETHKGSVNIISIQLVHNNLNINDSIITAWTLDSHMLLNGKYSLFSGACFSVRFLSGYTLTQFMLTDTVWYYHMGTHKM